MRKNKHLEEIRKEISDETREKVEKWADERIKQQSHGNPCPICGTTLEWLGWNSECDSCGYDKP